MTIWVAPNYRDTCPCKTQRRGHKDTVELAKGSRGRDGSDAATVQGTERLEPQRPERQRELP